MATITPTKKQKSKRNIRNIDPDLKMFGYVDEDEAKKVDRLFEAYRKDVSFEKRREEYEEKTAWFQQFVTVPTTGKSKKILDGLGLYRIAL